MYTKAIEVASEGMGFYPTLLPYDIPYILLSMYTSCSSHVYNGHTHTFFTCTTCVHVHVVCMYMYIVSTCTCIHIYSVYMYVSGSHNISSRALHAHLLSLLLVMEGTRGKVDQPMKCGELSKHHKNALGLTLLRNMRYF